MAREKSSLKENDIPPLVQMYYGLSTVVHRQLDSYDDQNFLVHVTPDSPKPDNIKTLCKHGYLIKVINAMDSKKPSIIDAQTKMIVHLIAHGYPTPAPVLSVNHRYSETIGTEDFPHNIRLFEFMPGKTLDKVPLTVSLCHDVGYYAGKLDRLLQTCTITENVVGSMKRKWNLSEVRDLRDLCTFEDPEQQNIILDVIDQFDNRILTRSESFSKGLIHSDFNDCNILVGKVQNTVSESLHIKDKSNGDTEKVAHASDISDDYSVCGIIDFGDSTYSLYIFELAIAIAYLVINQHGIPALVAAKHVLSGYSQNVELPEWELLHLRIAICARMAQSLVLNKVASFEEPDNEYLSTHTKRIWPVLKSLWQKTDSDVLSALT